MRQWAQLFPIPPAGPINHRYLVLATTRRRFCLRERMEPVLLLDHFHGIRARWRRGPPWAPFCRSRNQVLCQDLELWTGLWDVWNGCRYFRPSRSGHKSHRAWGCIGLNQLNLGFRDFFFFFFATEPGHGSADAPLRDKQGTSVKIFNDDWISYYMVEIYSLRDKAGRRRFRGWGQYTSILDIYSGS